LANVLLRIELYSTHVTKREVLNFKNSIPLSAFSVNAVWRQEAYKNTNTAISIFL